MIIIIIILLVLVVVWLAIELNEALIIGDYWRMKFLDSKDEEDDDSDGK